MLVVSAILVAAVLAGVVVYVRRRPRVVVVIDDPGTATSATPDAMGVGSASRIGLVGCVKQKQDVAAPARELYTSTLFRGRRRCVERSCERWFVLSAEHGLLDPDEVTEPYDVTLNGKSIRERRAWTQRVLGQIDETVEDVRGIVFEIHAGQAYVSAGLIEGLHRRGATVDRRMAGLRQGEQLAAYARGDCGEAEGDGDTSAQPVPRPNPPAAPHAGGAPRPAPGPRPASKYAPMYDHLVDDGRDQIRMTFDEIEAVLRFALPASASKRDAWWHHCDSHAQACAWENAGYRASPNLTTRTVTFRRAP